MNGKRSQQALTALALLVALQTGCGACAGGPPRNAEEFVAPDAPLIISVPSLGGLADHVQARKASARAAGNTIVITWLASLAGDQMLGFDPFTREGLKSAGLDPDRSLSVGGSQRKGGCAAIPYTDLDKALATARRLGPDRLGASVVETRKVGDTSVKVFAREAGGEAVAAYATQDRFLLFAMGDSAPYAVAAALTRKPEASAAKTGPFVATKQHLGARDLYFMIPKVPDGLYRFLPNTFAAGLAVTDSEVALRALFPVSDSHGNSMSRILVGGASPVAELPPDEPGYLRGSVDWVSLAKVLGETGPSASAVETLRAAFTRAGIDFDKDVLGNLQPGFALSMDMAPTASLSTALRLDPNVQNPFQNYSVVVLGEAKDAAKAQAAFAKLPQAIEPFGVTITTHDVGGSPVYTAHYKLGEGLSWTMHGNEIIAAGGLADHLDASLLELEKRTPRLQRTQFTPHAADALFSEAGVALALDLGRLSASVKRVPAGYGPGAFMAGIIENKLNDVARFRPVVAFSPAEGGVAVDVVTNVK
jgi:hypothetical protein